MSRWPSPDWRRSPFPIPQPGHLAGPGFRTHRGERKGCRHKDGMGSGAEGGSRFILRHRRGYCRLFRCSGRCRFSGCRILFRFCIRRRIHPFDRQQRIRTVLGFFLLLRHFSPVLHRCDNLRRTLQWRRCQCGNILCLPAGREQQNALQREQC